MNLQMRSFVDVGNLEKERVIMKADIGLDVGNYAVLRGLVGKKGGPSSGKKQAAYWFPDVEIKADDLVVLYSKKGTKRSKPLENGNTAYFFYWGSEHSLWNDEKYGAILLEVTDWQFEFPTPSPSE